MALFAITCQDKPGHLDLRLERRPDHFAYLKTQEPLIRVAGPRLDAQGQMCGSLFVIEAEDLAAAQAFSAGDPFTAVLFETVQITAFTKTLGSWS
jgi:uncharacterized protein YciI